MREINYTHNGGLPFSQNVAAFMQGTYGLQFGALAALLGDKVIITGVELISGNVTAGWITHGGRMIPFEAGLATANVDIIASTSDLLYEDGQTKQVYTTRVARCVNVGGFPFSELKRLSTIKTLMDMVVPVGMISMWAGTLAPPGWALCDGGGSPARPDLRSRFVVGYDPGDADYDAIGVGADLGRKQVELEVLNLPNHSHTINEASRNRGSGGLKAVSDIGISPGDATNTTRTTNETGGGITGQPHENRPPYYTLAYIIKL
jgi:microcystin-dependent protein